MDFPHISKCISLAEEPKLQDYNYIIKYQPIGLELFQQFCDFSGSRLLRQCSLFLQEVKQYQLKTEDERLQSAKFIYNKFMVGNSRNNEGDSDVNVWSEDGYCDTNALTKGTLNEILKPSTICELHQQLVSKNQNLFKKVVTEIHEFLKTDPFRQFQQSMYYHRYLQWVRTLVAH